MTKSRNILAPRRRWNAWELALLRAMYPHCHSADVAAWVGRTTSQVYQAAASNGLRKDPAYLASDTARRIQRGHQNPAMIASRFKPGIVPWNTGLKGATGTQEACRRTQFKKGTRPHTWLPVGTYRILKGKAGPVLELKTSDRPGANHMRWTPVSRLVWEKHNGPIPQGHIVVFKAGMSTTVLEQITPDRLDCITRAEHARRNHPRSRSPDLAKLVQLKGAITRQVNRIAREAEQRSQP